MKRLGILMVLGVGLLALCGESSASRFDRAGCGDTIRLGETRVFYKQNMRCSTAKHYARRLYKTGGSDEPRNFTCDSGSNFKSGAFCEHDFKNKRFGWHPFDKLGPAVTSSLSREDGAPLRREADCSDFSTQAAAQGYFIDQGGPGSDPDGLDADGDGTACEANPCPCSTGSGGGGGGGGSGPPSPPPPPPDPEMTAKLCGKFVGISGSRVCLKAVTKGEKLKQVEDFRFRGLPADCDGGSKPKVSGKWTKIDGDGKRFRSRRLSILGGFTGIDAKAVGKLKDGGKKVRGEVRVRFTNDAELACDTRARKFKVN